MKNVLLLCYDFPPTGGASVQRVLKFVKYLPKYGWNPFVISASSMNNKFKDETLVNEIPVNTIIEKVIDPLSTTSIKTNTIGKGLAKAVLPPDTYLLWRISAFRKAVQIINNFPIDIIYSTDPPSSHLLAYQIKRRYPNMSWIMDIRDLWTDNFTYRPISYIHGKLDIYLENKILLNADKVICVTDGFKKIIQTKLPEEQQNKILVINNGFDDDDFVGLEKTRNDVFTIVYSGQLYDFSVFGRPKGWKKLFEPFIRGSQLPTPVRSPVLFFEALKLLIDEFPNLRERIKTIFIGGFPNKYYDLVEKFNLKSNVISLGYVTHREAVEITYQADLLLLIQYGEGSQMVIPGKLFEYLRTGNPIIGLVEKGEASDIITKCRCGITIQAQDPIELKNLLHNWYQKWEFGENFINPNWELINMFNRERQTQILAKVMDELI